MMGCDILSCSRFDSGMSRSFLFPLFKSRLRVAFLLYKRILYSVNGRFAINIKKQIFLSNTLMLPLMMIR